MGPLAEREAASHSEETSLSLSSVGCPFTPQCPCGRGELCASDAWSQLGRGIGPSAFIEASIQSPAITPDGQLCTKTPVNPASSQRGIPGS